MEAHAVVHVVFLQDFTALLKLFLIKNNRFKIARVHVSLEAIFNVLFRVPLEIHIDRIVQVNLFN